MIAWAYAIVRRKLRDLKVLQELRLGSHDMTDRTRARSLAQESVDAGSPLDWFEVLYQEAHLGKAAVPWADLRPNPNLTEKKFRPPP